MKKKVATGALAAMGMLFIIGLVLIFSAPGIGQGAGDAALRANGGGMDTSQYVRIIDGSVQSCRLGGLVMALVGGCGLLISGSALYKEL
ncbi:MAG: hypothetical protein LBM74_07425 [Oscillospiraceae bacterium]|nr:hypothetical protein [Oscillospiraceae bacterium]